jgi:DNA-binding NarL/FixJ family response regulator
VQSGQHADQQWSEASPGEQALGWPARCPDVVIMDMHSLAGTERNPPAGFENAYDRGDQAVIQTDSDIAKSMLDAGAAAFVAKETAVNELYATLRAAAPRTTSSRSIASRPPRPRDGGKAHVIR